MRFFKRILFGAAWVLAFSLTAAQTIDDSFDVRGDCNIDQRGLLNNFVTETIDLVNTAIGGMDRFRGGGDRIMQGNLLTYFKAKKTTAVSSIDEIQQTLVQVRDFLNGDEELPGGGGKPRLYCSSRLWVRKNPGDTEQGKDGKTLPPDGQGPKTLLRRFAAELSEQIDGRAPLVFWTDQYNEYLISNDQGGQYFCDSPDRLAVTDDSDDIVPKALIMCPSSFELKPGSRPGRTRVIGDTKPNTKQNLDELEPRSLTFLHEVIHVVRGNAATIPERYGLFPAITSAKNDPGFARHNPDNYVYFALSYWFWQNKKYDAQGNTMDANSNQKGTKYNFANGKATPATVPP